MEKIAVGRTLVFIGADEALSGVRKIAEYVKRDIEKVTGHFPENFQNGGTAENAVIFGTLGRSTLLEKLDEQGVIRLADIKGKREVYSLTVVSDPLPNVKNALVIAGSDKRGTIYGLFRLSELIGVSPLVNWNCVMPAKKDSVILDESINTVSKEPSVRYRGFFINDEYPAFGTWAETHFGGVNAECYERVFELLLRLKGNYLWPAMWVDNFSMDGPGLKSAELADELGVVMSTSHHEPCMRTGEEYSLLRGENSPYGDAWSFVENEEGITRFWEDGLIRNKPFENVITMGMRGERDTAILGKDATLKDNIDLLKRVLRTQNGLIKKIINDDLDKVPRQMVLFSEVEEFIYGGNGTAGLLNEPELDGVTLMLSDNNHGMTRTLPTEEMRSRKGGFGMYYHMDMHGGAYSYQWVGATYLPRVWEQMTMAYEFGVREIWVVNIGDIGTQEHGLSYFLDLAYDIEKWGGKDASVTVGYTEEWLRKNFGNIFDEEELARLYEAYRDHLILLGRRRHEIMNNSVYHPVHFGEAEDVLKMCGNILDTCNALKKKCPSEMLAAYISLIYYPVCGTANLMRMWVLAGRNKLYAEQNRTEANLIADEIEKCFDFDDELTKEYHTVNDGYFYGFGLSEHIGFKVWNDEEYHYPIRRYVRPMNSAAMAVSRAWDENYMTGRYWTGKSQVWTDFMRPDVSDVYFDIAICGNEPIKYSIETNCKWLSFSRTSGEVSVSERICLHIDRTLFKGKAEGSFRITYKSPVQREADGIACANVTVMADNCEDIPDNVFLETDGYVCMEASDFQRKTDTAKGAFEVLSPYGKTGSGIKAFPVTADFTEEKEKPCAEYDFFVQSGGKYIIRFYTAPSTPVVYKPEQFIAFSVNGGDIKVINTVKDESRQFFGSRQWTEEAFDNIKITEAETELRAGANTLKIHAASPATVYERTVIFKEGCEPPVSYLGPKESYCRRLSDKV